MADANGIIFRNPTLNTWFVGPAVDDTAWNTITVSGCPDTAFNGDYIYDPHLDRWGKENLHFISKSLGEWFLTDSETSYTAPDNGLNIPPATFTRTLDYPLTITVSGTGTALDGTIQFFSFIAGHPAYRDGARRIEYNGRWECTIDEDIWVNTSTSFLPPKTGWESSVFGEPPPTLAYTLDATVSATVTSSSTATWASAAPTSGFVSLTDTPDADFGYIVTLEAITTYPYYLYVKKSGTVYGAFPDNPVRYGYIFAGWFSLPEGDGTRVEAGDALIYEDADHSLYAKWIGYFSGTVLNANGMFSLFTLSIGTDVFAEAVAPNYTSSSSANVTMPIPIQGGG